MLARSTSMISGKATAGGIGDSFPHHEIQNHRRVENAGEVSISRFGSASVMKIESVRTLDPLTDSGWDEFVARHPKSSVFHHRAWLQALARTYGYRPVVFTTSPPDAELRNGLLFCQIDSWLTGSRLVSLPFSDHCEPLCDAPEEMIGLTGGCRAFLDAGHGRYLEVRPTGEDVGRICSEAGFRRVGHHFLHVMDLRPDLETVYRGLDKDSVQRRIGRAERAGLIEKCGTSPDLLQEIG